VQLARGQVDGRPINTALMKSGVTILIRPPPGLARMWRWDATP
jgi:hypothetical protein